MTTNFVDLRMTRATTLEGLKKGETKLVWADPTPDRCCHVWAPEMHYIDGAWHIYYAAGPRVLGVQKSYVIRGEPSVCLFLLPARLPVLTYIGARRRELSLGRLLLCGTTQDARLGHRRDYSPSRPDLFRLLGLSGGRLQTGRQTIAIHHASDRRTHDGRAHAPLGALGSVGAARRARERGTARLLPRRQDLHFLLRIVLLDGVLRARDARVSRR